MLILIVNAMYRTLQPGCGTLRFYCIYLSHTINTFGQKNRQTFGKTVAGIRNCSAVKMKFISEKASDHRPMVADYVPKKGRWC